MNLPIWNNACTMLLLIGIDRSYLPTRLMEIRIKPLPKCQSVKVLGTQVQANLCEKRLVKQEFQGAQYCSLTQEWSWAGG